MKNSTSPSVYEKHPLAVAYDDRLRASKIPEQHILRRAKVSAGTTWRWRQSLINADPDPRVIKRLHVAIDELLVERAEKGIAK